MLKKIELTPEIVKYSKNTERQFRTFYSLTKKSKRPQNVGIYLFNVIQQIWVLFLSVFIILFFLPRIRTKMYFFSEMCIEDLKIVFKNDLQSTFLNIL